MAIEIRPFSVPWRDAVKEFNTRLAPAGTQLPEDPETEMLPGSAPIASRAASQFKAPPKSGRN